MSSDYYGRQARNYSGQPSSSEAPSHGYGQQEDGQGYLSGYQGRQRQEEYGYDSYEHPLSGQPASVSPQPAHPRPLIYGEQSAYGAAPSAQPYNGNYSQHPYDSPLNASTTNDSSETAVGDTTNPYSYDAYRAAKVNEAHVVEEETVPRGRFHLTQKAIKRLYWMVPLLIVGVVLVILFEVYKTNFENWISPLTNWMQEHKSWSWSLPLAILILLSFPPLFGHEIVLIVVGLVFSLGEAIGIACAGTILGEAACFLVFKLFFTKWVNRKRASNVKWEATARVCQQAGFKGVMLIRYSVVPPHLANPLFATTGMSFWLYILTVILSLPKNIVFVALGAPSNNSSGIKVAKVIAVGVLVVVTLYASLWMRKMRNAAKAEVRAERAGTLAPDRIHTLEPSASLGDVPLENASYRPAENGAPNGYGYPQ